jgi:hypothetical protein
MASYPFRIRLETKTERRPKTHCSFGKVMRMDNMAATGVNSRNKTLARKRTVEGTMTHFRKGMIALAMAGALAGGQAVAAEVSALAPGKPAGVLEAQHHGPSLLLIAGAATLVVIGVVIATQSSNNAVCSTCTAATATST